MTKHCLALVAVLALGVFQGPAGAQSVTIGDTTVQISSLRSDNGTRVTAEWAAFGNFVKTKQLLTWAGRELGCVAAPLVNSGFVNIELLRFTATSAPVPANQEVHLTFLPVTCAATRYPRATLALGLVRYMDAPQLLYPRLFVRYGNNGFMIEEVSYRKDGRPTIMTCKFGDCVFRTGLRIIEQRNGPAFRSLNTVFESTANESAFQTLARLYDVRKLPVGQGTLSMYSGILVASNLEEEYEAGFIDGTLDQNFKPLRTDSWIVSQAKQLAKDVIKNLVQQAGKALWSVIAGWLGL